MAKLLAALLAIVTGYLAGAIGGYAAVLMLSTNSHDRDVEAAMTGAFVTGPILAIVALMMWIVLRARRPTVTG